MYYILLTYVLPALFLGFILWEIKIRTRYQVRWVCRCGRPEKRTFKWVYSPNKEKDSEKFREYSNYTYQHRIKHEGRAGYDTCPKCGLPPSDARQYSTKLKGLPLFRRAILSTRDHTKELERLSEVPDEL